MSRRWSLPDNYFEFQAFCLRFFKKRNRCDGLQEYGKSGQKQYGIDLLDTFSESALLAVQCKLIEPGKKLKESKVREEVAKAEGAPVKVGHYVIATTADRDVAIQSLISELNQRPERKFTVEVVALQDIFDGLEQMGQVTADLICDPGKLDIYRAIAATPSLLAVLGGDLVTEDGSKYEPIDKLIENREIAVAEYELKKLPNPENDRSLSQRDKYAILRLMARVALAKAEFEEASRLFILAYDSNPTDEVAKLNRVLAWSLAGRRTEALAELTALRDEGVNSARFAERVVLCVTTLDELAPFDAVVQKHRDASEDVNIALTHLYLKEGKLEEAMAASARASLIAPDSAHALYCAGCISHHLVTDGPWQERKQNRDSALANYTKSLDAAKRENYPALVPEILINRSRMYGAYREADLCVDDARDAVSSTTHKSRYAEEAIVSCLHFHKHEVALSLLGDLDPNAPRTPFLTACVKHENATSSDVRRASIEELIKVIARRDEDACEAAYYAVQWSLAIKDDGLVQKCLSDDFVASYPFAGNTLLAWVEIIAGRKASASKHATKALASSASVSHNNELEVLIRVLGQLKRFDDAIQLLEQIYVPGLDDENSLLLEGLALKVGRHGIVLRLYRELRECGKLDVRRREIEAGLLVRYDPERLIALVATEGEYATDIIIAARNYALLALGREAEIDFENWKLPDPSELEPQDGNLVIDPLLASHRYREAVVYAYRLARAKYDSEDACSQFVWNYARFSNLCEFGEVSVVGAESAVLLRDERTETDRWLSFDDERPQSALGEYSTSSEVYSSLRGKRVGDVVKRLAPGVIQDRPEQIVAIVHRVERFEGLVRTTFADRFPGSVRLQPIFTGSGDAFDPSELIRIVQHAAERAKIVVDAYNAGNGTLHSVGQLLGRTIREVMISLPEVEGGGIRCAKPGADGFVKASRCTEDGSSVVLDVSAIVTIDRLGLWETVGENQKLLVSHTTKNEVVSWHRNAQIDLTSSSAISEADDDGEVTHAVVPPEVKSAVLHDLAKLVANLDRYCTVVAPANAADIDPDTRDLYSRGMGIAALDAICVANEQGAVLWTDEYLIGVAAESQYGLNRTWTQALLASLMDREKISQDDYSLAVTKLVAWNYLATSWGAHELLTAAEHSDWDPHSLPLSKFLAFIKESPNTVFKKTVVVAASLKLLSQAECSLSQQSPVILTLLNALGSIPAVKLILRDLGLLSKCDANTFDHLAIVIKHWLVSR
jgi:tetratricopeptide (TPR) repeat protein